MYFCVVRMTFESESDSKLPDRKDMHSFLDKLRARFRIVAQANTNMEDDGVASFSYASLAISEESLTKQMDAISAFAEDQGFGRIADEAVLMDTIDSIGNEDLQ